MCVDGSERLKRSLRLKISNWEHAKRSTAVLFRLHAAYSLSIFLQLLFRFGGFCLMRSAGIGVVSCFSLFASWCYWLVWYLVCCGYENIISPQMIVFNAFVHCNITPHNAEFLVAFTQTAILEYFYHEPEPIDFPFCHFACKSSSILHNQFEQFWIQLVRILGFYVDYTNWVRFYSMKRTYYRTHVVINIINWINDLVSIGVFVSKSSNESHRKMTDWPC